MARRGYGGNLRATVTGGVRRVLARTGLIWSLQAMKRVKIAEFKSQLSRHLRAVERGAEIEITDRDRPIARLVPVKGVKKSRLIPAELPVSALLRKRFRPAKWKTPSLELLLEDRRKR